MSFPACPVCRSRRTHIVETLPPYRTLRCPGCGLAFVDPLPDSGELARHYGEDYYAEWVSSQKQPRESMWAKRVRIIEKWARPGRLLDAGCGEGLFLEVAKASGWQVEGTEVSNYAADFASRQLRQPIFCGDLWQADFAERSFDVVTLWHVLEHVTQPIRLMNRARLLLKADGLLVLAVPNIEDLFMQAAYRLVKGRRPRLFSLSDKEVHLYHYSPKSLKLFLQQCGFECIHVGPDSGIFERSKKLINGLAVIVHWMTGLHFYNSIQVIARPTRESRH